MDTLKFQLGLFEYHEHSNNVKTMSVETVLLGGGGG